MDTKVEHKGVVLLGDTWQYDDGSTWRVVSARDGVYGLSGPGPCRSIHWHVKEIILEKAVLIERNETKRRKDP